MAPLEVLKPRFTAATTAGFEWSSAARPVEVDPAGEAGLPPLRVFWRLELCAGFTQDRRWLDRRADPRPAVSDPSPGRHASLQDAWRELLAARSSEGVHWRRSETRHVHGADVTAPWMTRDPFPDRLMVPANWNAAPFCPGAAIVADPSRRS